MNLGYAGMTWRHHPLRVKPWWQTAALLFIMISFAAVVYFTMDNDLIVSLAVLLILFLAMLRYFLPTSYEISDKGVAVTFLSITRFRSWNEIRRYVVFNDGLVVSQFSRPHRLENFRQLYLKYNPEQQREVQTCFEKYYREFKAKHNGI